MSQGAARTSPSVVSRESKPRASKSIRARVVARGLVREARSKMVPGVAGGLAGLRLTRPVTPCQCRSPCRPTRATAAL